MAKQQFGGDWTEDKLSRIKKYFERYNIALKNQRFSREYIDAFAGTGYREVRCEETDDAFLFPELAKPRCGFFLDGSARIALNVDPGFTRFTFIEKNANKVKDLLRLANEFPGKNIRIDRGTPTPGSSRSAVNLGLPASVRSSTRSGCSPGRHLKRLPGPRASTPGSCSRSA